MATRAVDGNKRLIKTSRWAVAIVLLTNRIFMGAVTLGLLSSWLFSGSFASLLLQENPRVHLYAQMTGLRLMMMLGIVMAIASEVFLATLARMIVTARDGEFFTTGNAQKLQTMGWALLTLQLLDVPAALITKFFPSLGSAAPGVNFSPGGWIAVLMVFVLSHIFATGSAMQDDLEGTV